MSLAIVESTDTRPVIRTGTEIHATCDEAVDALARDADLYQRTGLLCHVTRSPGEAPIIRLVTAANLRERLTACARWERASTKKLGAWERCTPPDAVVQAVLHPGRAGARVRHLMGLLEAPSIRPDGTAIEEPGYDALTGYLYEPEIVFPRIPRTLSRELAARALTALREPFEDFPFRGEADRMAIVAALLTIIARPAIAGSTPAFIVDASTPGSGKTLIADVVAIIATGRGAPRMTFSADPEEVSKNLGACALQGERLAGRGRPGFRSSLFRSLVFELLDGQECGKNIARPFRGDLRRFTHLAVDAGADVVVGSGPHVLRGMEVYRDRLIAYSLGNFATYGHFNRSGNQGLGAIVDASLDGEGRFLGGRIFGTRQTGRGIPVPDPANAAADLVRTASE